MKRLIFMSYNMQIGGIERALLSLLNNLNYKKYEVTLMLEKKEGELLKEIPNRVKIIEYKLNNNKIKIFRKLYNRFKLIYTILKNYRSYDFSCCYAPYSKPLSILSKYFSNNNSIWIHSDYYHVYKKNEDDIRKFFDDRKINKFNKIFFVSNESRSNFLNFYPNLKDKTIVCNNFVDYDKILLQSKEKVTIKKSNKTVFINVSRHDEDSKRLTKLISSCNMLKKDGYSFEVLLIGDGPDNKLYRKLVEENNLSDEIKFLGMKKNPYPYFKLANAFILTSDYEGFPVVYLESLIFNIPIITTIDVSNNNLKIKDNYGILVEKNEESIYEGMKLFIDNGFKIKEKFNPQKYNKNILNILEKIMNEDV